MFTSWHSYPSIFNLGHKALDELLLDPVLVQEKVDGSQFSFGLFDGEYKARSKGATINTIAPDKMFAKGVAITQALPLHDGWTYRGEYLIKPKHNALAYDRIPNNHIILFDINTGHEEYLPYEAVVAEGARLGLEVVPLLFSGMVGDIQLFRTFLEHTSTLGGQKVEGVVIKNYARFGPDKKALMGKFVAEAFKEVHKVAWGEGNPKGKDILETLTATYRHPARWQKAVQHLMDAGSLEGSPRDIGLLIQEVPTDIEKEEQQAIKDILYAWAWPHIRRGVVRGFAEWYKERLLERQFNKEEENHVVRDGG